jgi:hypothetical protein
LKAKLSQDPVYAPRADLKSSLTELLRNHLTGKIGIQKPIAHDLTNDLASPPIISLRSPPIANETGGAMRMKKIPNLKIALTAVPKLPGGMRWTLPAALPLHKHGQLYGDFVVRINRQ